MKKIITAVMLLPLVFLGGCWGHSSSDNTIIGQVKKVKRMTPFICDNRVDVDVSLGIMRNGVGSMSTQDMWLTVANPATLAALNYAADNGTPVQITYDTARMNVCWNVEELTGIQYVK